MISRLANRLILKPTTQPVFSFGKKRNLFPFKNGQLEVWTHRADGVEADDVEFFILKFAGTCGRAERTSSQPMDFWSDVPAEMWSMNPPGYGGSTGPARMVDLAEAGRTAYDHLRKVAGDRPILVVANSLGATIALHIAACRPVSGLILRNPPPIRELVIHRFGWWNLGAIAISRQVPAELCSLSNAAKVAVPALFVLSGRDRIVPAACQEMVLQAYQGKYKTLRMKYANHDTPMSPDHREEYNELLDWLREKTIGTRELALAGH